MLQTLSVLKNDGTTIFLVSHRMDVLSIADNLLIMAAGKISKYGTKEHVLASLNQNHSA